MLAVADGEDAPGLGLDPTQLMELLQARGTRLVEHDILAGPHRTDGHGRPLAGNAGTEDEQDLGSSRMALILDPARLRVALGVAGGETPPLG